MQRKEHCLFESRSPNPPSWAVNLRELSLLLARYMELRAGIVLPRIDSPENRIVFAQRKIIADMTRNVATLDKLIAERMASTDPDRRRVLEIQIRTLDARLCVDQRGPSLIIGVIFYFFRCGYTSPETAQALKNIISSQAVRQIALRLQRLWQRMQDDQDRKPSASEIRNADARARYHLRYKPKQNAYQRRRSAAMTPEQKTAVAAYHHKYWLKNKERMMAQRRANFKVREKALLKYHSATGEEIAARRERWKKYARENRERLLANKRKSAKRRYKAMSAEEKARANQKQRDYYAAHKADKKVIRDRCRATKARYLAKKHGAQVSPTA